MGLTSAFLSARSGLAATERWSDTTAANIANAGTPGYTRKTLEMETRATGTAAPVMVSGVRRDVDASLARMFRQETGMIAAEQLVADALDIYSAQLGQPEDEISPVSRLAALNASLLALSNDPSEPALQQAAVDDAESLARGMRRTADVLAQVRANTGEGIARDVRTLNEGLEDLAALNQRLYEEGQPSLRRASLMDEIDKRLDALAEIVDFRVSRDEFDRVSVATTGGAQLLEGTRVYRVAFDPVTAKLDAEGVDISPGTPGVRGIGSGRLAGGILFYRDTVPRMELQLDEFVRSLIEGFEGADASIGAGQAGLFTDAGQPYDPASRTGLARRLSVNDAVRPAAGGELWRIRDGMGAASQGPQGDSTQVLAFLDQLSAPKSYDTAAALGSDMPLARYAASMVADQQVLRSAAATRAEEYRVTAEAVEGVRQGIEGVNIDEELQQLMVIEQSYAANAQMMKAIDEMMKTLLSAF